MKADILGNILALEGEINQAIEAERLNCAELVEAARLGVEPLRQAARERLERERGEALEQAAAGARQSAGYELCRAEGRAERLLALGGAQIEALVLALLPRLIPEASDDRQNGED